MLNQQLAFDKFKRLKVGAVFMQMGTGKTKVAIDLINYNKDRITDVLFIAPKSTLENAKREFDKWQSEVPVKFVGYETISSSDRTYLEVLDWVKDKDLFIIADESTFIKNEEAKRSKRLLQLRKHAKYALVLNGTPITKNEWDLYNQMEFLSPKIINMGRNEFRATFFDKITYKKKNKNPKTFYKFSKVNVEYLKKLIEPYVVEAKLDIGVEEEEEVKSVIPTAETIVEYSRIKHNLLNSDNLSEIIKTLTKMQMTIAIDKDKSKAVADFIRDRQVIVYVHYLKELEEIMATTPAIAITGSTRDRTEKLEEFRNSNKPLIMTYGVGSFGLNLQFCNEIVFSSTTFDYAKMEQAKYRIKRIGQDKPIKYTYFKSTLGIQNLIDENIQRKTDLHKLIEEKMEDDKWLKSI